MFKYIVFFALLAFAFAAPKAAPQYFYGGYYPSAYSGYTGYAGYSPYTYGGLYGSGYYGNYY